ncbi:type II secretion system F family protein [Candidatus Saccharibacteria bacterium]|nr:type II secretion system F family protein [Candidatus Saccharibacteria bacterium]MBQ9016678.1 type II secretion system F family protein [Candidatus Saccharibacteria bacterium]
MKRFNYQAIDSKTGKSVKGVIQADTERNAGKLLIEQGFVPQKVVEENTTGLFAKAKNRITAKDRIVFTRQFATLIGAGLPLANALRLLAEQTTSPGMKSVVEDLLANIEAGKSLTQACEAHPKVFDRLFLALVSAGELSGTLDESLKRLADQQEKDQAMISRIRGAMIYPAIVLVVIIFVMVFMLVEVVPQVEALYRDLGEELPGMTQVLVAMANFIIKDWWLILLVLFVLVWIIMNFRTTKSGVRTAALIKLNVPLFKGLFHRLYNARFARTAQILLMSGVPMIDVMTISAESTANVVMQENIVKASEKVKAGKALSDSLEGVDYILPLVPQMAAIGEQSGKIDEMLGRAATVYENELDEKINSISTMIEPVLMIFLAGMMVFMIGAILMPIYSLVNSIG